MPFLKIENKSSGTYLRIVESYRDEAGTSRHRILHSLGKVQDYTSQQLRTIGIKLYELGGGEVKALLKGSLEELGRYNYGYYQVYTNALRHYGLDKMMDRIANKHKLSYNFKDAVLLMLLERLQAPCSKRSNYIHQSDYAALEPVYLQHLYRSLDRLADNSERIQKHIFETGRNLFNSSLDVVFYDVTTLYFESAKESEEPNRTLRRKGFSKDGKHAETQILFCMLIDRDKRPVGYQIFKGNTYEGHTFVEAIERLKKRYDINKVIVVADRGMMNKNNLAEVIENDFEFIVGERLKNLSKNLKQQLINLDNYKQEWHYIDEDNEPVVVRYTTMEHQGKTIIATYSAKRAAKDKHDRERLIDKAQKLLLQPEQLESKAKRHFLKQTTTKQYEIDETKIEASERYDGFLAISTNNKSLATVEILDQYKHLYTIEHTFRSFKSHLEMRPMFHWTDKRIEGHICLCYIAYTLQHYVLQKLSKFPIPITENILREMLDKMQVSLMLHNDEKVYLRSAPQPHEQALQRSLGLKSLPPILAENLLTNYI
jgi:transposase